CCASVGRSVPVVSTWRWWTPYGAGRRAATSPCATSSARATGTSSPPTGLRSPRGRSCGSRGATRTACAWPWPRPMLRSARPARRGRARGRPPRAARELAGGPVIPFDLARPKRIHVVGVGGAGMSAIATVLARMGHAVSGSDLKASAGLERLRALGVHVTVGHDAANVGDVDAVTTSTAVAPANPELAAARERGIPVLRRAEALAAIAATRRTLAVAGTHGKAPAARMLALV